MVIKESVHFNTLIIFFLFYNGIHKFLCVPVRPVSVITHATALVHFLFGSNVHFWYG